MAVKFSTGLRNGMLDSTGFIEAFNLGFIYIYSGPQPTSPDDDIPGSAVLLGKVSVDAGGTGLTWATPVAGVVAKAAAENWQFNGITDGTAGWFRLVDSGDIPGGASTTEPRLDGSIATYGSDMNLSNVSITTGAPNTIDVFQLTMAEA